MALLERLLAALAQRHQLGHVDLVEGGEHGRRALRLDEVARDRQAALRHAHALSARVPGARGGAGGRPARPASAPWRAARRRRSGRRGAGAAAGGAGAWIWPATSFLVTRPASPLPATPARSTSCASAILRAVGVARLAVLGVARRRPRLARLPAGAGVGGRRRRRRRGSARPWRRRSTTREHLADLHVLAFLACLIFASTPACSAPTSRSIFSVSSSTSGSPAATASPSLLQPARDARFDDRFTELGDDDVDGHGAPLRTWRAPAARSARRRRGIVSAANAWSTMHAAD